MAEYQITSHEIQRSPRITSFGTAVSCGAAIMENFPWDRSATEAGTGVYLPYPNRLEREIKELLAQSRAGVVIAVLAPDQEASVGPILLKCGFVRTHNFLNRVHNWPNYLYVYEYEQTKVVEHDRAFTKA